MIHQVALDHIKVSHRRRSWRQTRLWRECCFLESIARHFFWRMMIMVGVLATGTVLFWQFEDHSFVEALFFTWILIFGEPPEDFPEPVPLQIVFFVVPVIGLLILLEAMVEFALILRDRRRNEYSWCRTMSEAYSNHIVIIGFGRLGFRAYTLLKRLGEPCVIIERDPENQFLEEARRDGTPLFIGDARREAILDDAHVSRAKSIILATTDDLANLEVALDARRINPDVRVVLRMFDQNMANKIREGFNIHIAMSESAMSAPAFATAAIDPSIINSFVVNNELIVIRRWRVQPGGPLSGQTVGGIMAAHSLSVVERVPRKGPRTLFPPPDTRLEADDDLLVQGRFDVLQSLRAKDKIVT